MKCGCRITWLGALFLLFVCFVASRISAQDNPPVHTQFSAGCIEALGELHYRIHFGYVSDGVEAFNVAFENVNNGAAFINTPGRITTAAGVHDEWYLDAHTVDSPYTFTVTFNNGTDSHVVALNTWTRPACSDGQYPPDADATPEPPSETVTDDCPAWALESATGKMICLWRLPKVGDWQ